MPMDYKGKKIQKMVLIKIGLSPDRFNLASGGSKINRLKYNTFRSIIHKNKMII